MSHDFSPLKRDLIIKVADGYAPIFPMLHQMDRFVHSFHLFKYLVAQRLTGKKLYDSIVFEHKGSWFDFSRTCFMKIKKDLSKQDVIAGKDFIV